MHAKTKASISARLPEDERQTVLLHGDDEAVLARGRLGVNSSIAKPAISVGAPCEQLTAGGGHRCMVLGHSHHCYLPPTQASDCSGNNDGTLSTMNMEIRVTCKHHQWIHHVKPVIQSHGLSCDCTYELFVC